MNSEISALAFGSKCGGRGFRSIGRFSPRLPGSASRLSACSRCASANAPTPKAERVRSSRRVGMRGSVNMEELVGGQDLLTEVGEGGQFGAGLARGAELPRLPVEESAGEVDL